MHMGVFQYQVEGNGTAFGFPHAHGGVSKGYVNLMETIKFSPCIWGCFLRDSLDNANKLVFPMHMGVFLYRSGNKRIYKSFPHAHGGVSVLAMDSDGGWVFSPCTWGCFSWVPKNYVVVVVFPMHMGVFLSDCLCVRYKYSFPHAHGGVSPSHKTDVGPEWFSPCTWGCFRVQQAREQNAKVFPMHMGVFLSSS